MWGKGSLEQNAQEIDRLISRSKELSRARHVPFFDLEKCTLFCGLPSELILQFLDAFLVSENNVRFSSEGIKKYISEQNRLSKLNEWSVALMSLKTGAPIYIGGVEAIPVRRNVKHEFTLDSGETEVTLRAVSVPGEELIDLADRISSQFRTTDQVMKSESGETKSDTRLRKELRPENRGLLLIYPLESNLGMSDDAYRESRAKPSSTYPLRAAAQAFAVSFVFPFSRTAVSSLNYSKNKTVARGV